MSAAAVSGLMDGLRQGSVRLLQGGAHTDCLLEHG
jgi:hypothetical protein